MTPYLRPYIVRRAVSIWDDTNWGSKCCMSEGLAKCCLDHHGRDWTREVAPGSDEVAGGADRVTHSLGEDNGRGRRGDGER